MLSILSFLCRRSAAANIYQKHLPSALYDYLNEKQLLDAHNHELICTAAPERNITLSIKIEPAENEFPEMMTITLKTNPIVTTTYFTFTEKVYFQYAYIDERGTDFLAPGNRKSSVIEGLFNWECVIKTPHYVDMLLQTMNSLSPAPIAHRLYATV